MQNLKVLLSESVVCQVLQLSSLVTLSSRIHQHTPNPGGCGLGQHHAPLPTTPQCRQLLKDLNTLKVTLKRKLNDGPSSDLAERDGGSGWGGEASGSGEGGRASARWKMVDDMSVWLQCPLGLCPGQTLSSDMFEIDQLTSSGKEVAGVGYSGMDDTTVLQGKYEPTPVSSPL